MNNFTFLVNKELFKVPLDALETQKTWLFRLEPFPQWVSLVTVDVNLLHDWEGDTKVNFAKLRNLLGRAWLLAGKLVAWESDNLQALVVVLLVELFEVCVLLGEAALGGGVDNKHHLALEVCHWEWLAVVFGCIEGVELGHGLSCC